MKSSRFSTIVKLLNSDLSRARLHEIKDKGGYNDDDPIWSYIFALENYQRIYEEMPEAINKMAIAESTLLSTKITYEVTESIAKDAARRIDEIVSTRERVETYLSKSIMCFAGTLLVVLAIAMADMVKMIESAMAPSKFELWRYMYDIPVGHFIIVLAAWSTILFFFRSAELRLDKWFSKSLSN